MNWAFAAFAGILAVYEITDLVNGEISVHHALTHLPVLAGAVLTWMVASSPARRTGPSLTSSAGTGDTIVLPDKAALDVGAITSIPPTARRPDSPRPGVSEPQPHPVPGVRR